MSKETLTTQDLVSDTRQNRFLQELEDHAEDAGGTKDLGEVSQLAEVFNSYATPKRNVKLLLIFIIGLISFFSVFVMNHGVLWDNNFLEYRETALTPFYQVTAMLGLVLQFPVMMAVLMPLYAFLSIVPIDVYHYPVFETYYAFRPPLTCAFWVIISSMLLFSPEIMRIKIGSFFTKDRKQKA